MNSILRCILVVLVLLLYLEESSAQALDGGIANLSRQVENTLHDIRREYDFPGITVAYTLPNNHIESIAIGFADLESQLPMTNKTRMLAASIGKSFVAVIILSLESEGLLSQNDLVKSHLGDRSWFDRMPNQDEMTIGNLLRHTSGLQDHVYLDSFSEAMKSHVRNDRETLTAEDAIGLLLDSAPLFQVGEGWSYSDTGYLLLGLIIESVTEESYYAVLNEKLLSPLGLVDTSAANNRELVGLAPGYTFEDNPFGLPFRTMDDQGKLLWDPAVEWTGGGLVTTATDLASWGHLLFGSQALSVPYIDRLLEGEAILPGNSVARYGAGVGILEESVHGPVHGHGGWVPGYTSSLRHYADHNVTIAFQMNSDVGVADDGTDLVAVLERTLADVIIRSLRH